MINNRVTEGVGKKIVEALKQQNDIEITTVNDTFSQPNTHNYIPDEPEVSLSQSLQEAVSSVESSAPKHDNFNQTFNFSQLGAQQQEPVYSSSPIFNPQPSQSTPDLTAVEEMDLPANVAVLKQLISQLPSGVSKHTGAMIIKQTMEALGIPMNNVLQEAQQVQESINQSARECQNSILEYKKQINILEAQTQKYQKQYAAVNDIISLFIQTNL